jgi:hypothetical protein
MIEIVTSIKKSERNAKLILVSVLFCLEKNRDARNGRAPAIAVTASTA